MFPLEEVPVSRFDCYWLDSRFIDYVKIDVEGHEMDVIKGFGSIISLVKLVQFEFGSAHIDKRVFFKIFATFFNLIGLNSI